MQRACAAVEGFDVGAADVWCVDEALVVWVVGAWVKAGVVAGFAEGEVDDGAAGDDDEASEEAAAPSGEAAVVGVVSGEVAVELALCPAPTACGEADPDVADPHAAAARTVSAQANADAHRCRSMGSPPEGQAPAAGQNPTLADVSSNRNA
ncbi:hypothetical protein [Catenulispora subtropica]